ncbi:MAG: hypothetical protein HQ518_14620 [Rhodopirellula sp.]|nr:hypothetical protein [Rhodopirellula sp.]
MIKAHLPFIVFAVAGLVSGLLSGLLVILQPLGIIAPGLLFGAALGHSFNASITPISLRQRAALNITSTFAFWCAIVATLLSARLPGFGNGFLYGAFAGAIGGGVGAMIVAIALVVIVPMLSRRRTLIIVTVAGACFGAIFVLCGVYISDYTTFGHPFDNIVSFPLWQTGVAAVVPFCKRCSTTESNA